MQNGEVLQKFVLYGESKCSSSTLTLLGRVWGLSRTPLCFLCCCFTVGFPFSDIAKIWQEKVICFMSQRRPAPSHCWLHEGQSTEAEKEKTYTVFLCFHFMCFTFMHYSRAQYFLHSLIIGSQTSFLVFLTRTAHYGGGGKPRGLDRN